MKNRVHSRKVAFAALLVLIVSVFAVFAACGNLDLADTGDKGNADKQFCVVAFYENGGSEVMPQRVEVGGLIAKPDDPERDGYTFGGWYKDRNFLFKWNFDSDKVSGDIIMLYAKWTAVDGDTDDPEPIPSEDDYCLVTFVTDVDNETVQSQSVILGGKVETPRTLTKTGYTFDGWYTSDGKKWDFAKDTVSGSALVLTAKWTLIQSDKKTCSVTFISNCATPVSSQIVEVGGKVKEPPQLYKEGYTFDGWYNGSKKWDFAKDTVSGSALVLTAKWTPVPVEKDTCVISFVTGCSAKAESQTVEVGGKVKQPSVNNPGYTLDGWYTPDGKKWDFDKDTVSGKTLTLTARWSKINEGDDDDDDDDDDGPIIGTGEEVTVTFNVGLSARKAGVYNPAAVTVKAGGTIAEPKLTRSGYKVSGWYVEESSTKWNFSKDTVKQNMTLFAAWEASSGTSIDYTPTMKNDNTLYIHYLRNDGAYDGWCAWVWTTGSGTRKTSTTVDASGTVFAVDLSQYGSASTVNFIIAIISSDNKFGEKDGGDNAVTLSNTQKVGGSYHWYVTQGNVANGGNKPVAADKIGGTTEEKRASKTNVNRQTAQKLPVMSTASDWDEMGVGYQIFVASFCDSDGDGVGDLNGITSKLDYLQSLNVDVLWLTPIQSSDSYHGYDCYDYYCIDKKFGTNADYRRLVSEVHKRGMKIIMDLVINHTSTQNEWFVKSKAGVIEEVTYQDGTKATVNYRDFYRWKNSGGNRYNNAGDGWYYYSSFGSSMPELNYDYQPVRDAMADVAMYWMGYGLDGFRLDAIKHLFMWEESDNAGSDTKGGANDPGYEYNLTKDVEALKEFNYKLKKKYPFCFILGEQLSGNPSDVAPFYAGMDSLFDFNTYYDLPSRLNSGASAQSAAFNSNAQKYEQYRQDRPINSMITSNHDIDRLHAKVGNSAEKTKLYMAVIMTMPGLSWIYYGDEIGLIGDKSKYGDNGVRQSMKWTSSWANKCTAIPDQNLNGNTKSVADQEKDNSSLLSYVKSLTKFRNDNPALISGKATCSESNGMLKISVTGGGKTYTVYHNFSGSSKSVSGNVVFGSSSVPAYGTAIVKN